jgi:MFS family permease
MKGRDREALSILQKASGPEEAEKNLEEIRASIVSDAKRERVPLAELFAPALRLVLAIGIIIAVIQQITGINAVFFYAPMIFEQSGIGTDAAFSQAILVGLINLVFTILAMGLIDRLGRKPLLMFGLAGITISMALLAYGFYSATYCLSQDAIAQLPQEIPKQDIQALRDQTFTNDVAFKRAVQQAIGTEFAKQYESEFISTAIRANPGMILVGILGFVACFAISLGPVMWVLFSEMFPNRIRGVAISFVGFINSGVSFLVQLVFPWSLANLGSATTFLLFGAFAAVGLVLLSWLLPETKGRSLEELEAELVRG